MKLLSKKKNAPRLKSGRVAEVPSTLIGQAPGPAQLDPAFSVTRATRPARVHDGMLLATVTRLVTRTAALAGPLPAALPKSVEDSSPLLRWSTAV
jgi:hypothetical protein